MFTVQELYSMLHVLHGLVCVHKKGQRATYYNTRQCTHDDEDCTCQNTPCLVLQSLV